MRWLRKPYLRIGRLVLWPWSGEWTPWPGRNESSECICCAWNYYVGPFGIEWFHKNYPSEPEEG